MLRAQCSRPTPSLLRPLNHLCGPRRRIPPLVKQMRASSSALNDRTWPHPIASSDPILVLKSSFQAFTTRLSPLSSASIPRLMDQITADYPRAKRATHIMFAWRSSSLAASGPVESGSSDGGESGAGEHLTRLLELCKCEDVVLVVLRWYGGVQMGGQRWRSISAVAKEALERGGFVGVRDGSNYNTTKAGDAKTRKSGRRRK